MRTSLIGLVGLIFTFVTAPAWAQDEGPRNTEVEGPVYDTAPPSDFQISANAALVTDYRFRGVSFSGGKVAVQGGVDIVHSSGFYVGTWASSLQDSVQYGSAEVDLYGGWSGAVSSGITVDAGLLYYYYPDGNRDLGGPSDYFEPYASVSGQLGPLQATAGIAYSWSGQDSLNDQDSTYLYLDLSSGIPTTPMTVTVHGGYTDGFNSYNDEPQSFDFSIGASYAINSAISVGATYTTVEAPEVDNFTDDGLFATLSATF